MEKIKKILPISRLINLSYSDYDEGDDVIYGSKGITSTWEERKRKY